MRGFIKLTVGIGFLGLSLFIGELVIDWYDTFSWSRALKSNAQVSSENSDSNSRSIASVESQPMSEVLAIAKSLEKDSRIPLGEKKIIENNSNIDPLWAAHLEDKGLKEFDKELGKFMKDSQEEKMIKQLLVLNHEGVTHTPEEYRMIGQAHEQLLKNPVASANFIKDAFEEMPADAFAKERSYLMQLAMQLTEDASAKNVIEQMLMKEMQKDYGPYNPENISSSMPVIAISSYFAMTLEPEKRQAAGQMFLNNQKDPQLIQMYQSMIQQSSPAPSQDMNQSSQDNQSYNNIAAEFNS